MLAPRLLGAMLLLFVLSLAACLFELGRMSIWYDEAVSLSYASDSAARAWQRITSRDSNGALYYLILWAWVHIAGSGEGIARLPSAVLAAASIPVVYLLGHRLFSPAAGLLAALLLATQGFFAEYAQQARSYSLALLLATLATYVLVRAVESGRRRTWVAYGTIVAAGVYAHLFVAFVALAHVLWSLRRPTPRGPMVIGVGVAALLALPMLAFVVLNRGPSWMGGLEPEGVALMFRTYASGSWLNLGVFATLVGLAGVRLALTRSAGLGLVLLWLAVPILAMLAISAFRPFLVTRYVLVTLPALALGVAAVVTIPRSRAVMVSSAIAVLLLSFSGLVGWHTSADRADWRSATQYVAREATDDDAVVFYPGRVDLPFRYYLERLSLQVPLEADAASAGRCGW